MRVAILGGGLRALACAHYLLRDGCRPVILEPAGELEALASPCARVASQWSAFDVFVTAQDAALAGLMAELELQAHVAWSPMPTELFLGGRLQPVAAWSDLERLSGPTAGVRLRTVSSALRAEWMRPTANLAAVAADEWLSRRYGPDATARLWRPLLDVLLGPGSGERVSAHRARLALRAVLGSEVGCRGDLPGGLAKLVHALARSVVRRGGQIRLRHRIGRVSVGSDGLPVTHGELSETWDALILAGSTSDWSSRIDPALRRSLAVQCEAAAEEPIELVSVVAFVRAPPRSAARVLLIDRDSEGACIVDPGPGPDGARSAIRPIYVTQRYAAGSARPPDSVVEKQARTSIVRALPIIRPESIEDVSVHRLVIEERRWVAGPRSSRPARLPGCHPLYLCGADQNPLRLPGPEASVMSAREVVGAALRDHSVRQASSHEVAVRTPARSSVADATLGGSEQ